MEINEIGQIYNQYKLKGTVVCNFIATQICYSDILDLFCEKKAALFTVPKRNNLKVFFIYVDDEEGINDLCALMEKLPCGVTLDWFQKGTESEKYNNCVIGPVLNKCGLELYKKYIRISSTYKENPKLVPEIGRRKILWDMYEPGGEWPSIEDADELFQINSSTFDSITDDVFSKEEWMDIIGNKQCLVHREDGKIVTYYVWELQGKTLYSNIAVNQGPANYLYNIERRVFEHYWNEGIRSFYAWFNVKNRDALKRGNSNPIEKEKCLKNRSILYNYIYIK